MKGLGFGELNLNLVGWVGLFESDLIDEMGNWVSVRSGRL